MRKLLRHGRNSKPSSGGGSIELIAVGDFLTWSDVAGNSCTLYEPNAMSTTFYNWYEGDGVDVYLFGTFSSNDIHSLKVYVDGILSSDTFSDVTDMWGMENSIIAEDFDNVLDAYVMGVPVDGQYHTITVKTSDDTIIHTYNVRLFTESGVSSSTGTVYKVYKTPIQSIFDAFIEGGLTDVGKFIYGDPPGINPYLYVAPLDFDNFYNREFGGYQTLLCQIHLRPGFISDNNLRSNLKVASVSTTGGEGRISDSKVSVGTEAGIQYVSFSVDIDMSSVTSSFINYDIYLKYNGRKVIDFAGKLGFYN